MSQYKVGDRVKVTTICSEFLGEPGEVDQCFAADGLFQAGVSVRLDKDNPHTHCLMYFNDDEVGLV